MIWVIIFAFVVNLEHISQFPKCFTCLLWASNFPLQIVKNQLTDAY